MASSDSKSAETLKEENVAARQFAHLDEANLGWFHLRTILVAGVGFFTDAYDLFIIGLALPMIWSVYTEGYSIKDPHYKFIDGLVKASAFIGNFIGQVGFGYLGDKLGRKKMYGVELLIMVVATFGSALSAPTKSGLDTIGILAIWRFFLGVGVGGDYPMSAVITSEFANVKYRGMMLSAVFAMQGIGYLMGGIVTIITLLCFKQSIIADKDNLDYVWRIIIGFGIVPALCAVYFRVTIPETPRFTVDVSGDVEKAANDVTRVLQMNQVANISSTWTEEQTITDTSKITPPAKSNDFFSYFGKIKNALVLFGTAYTWFALDIAWYGLSLNSDAILKSINFNNMNYSTDTFDINYNRAFGQIIINLMGTVPGYWVTVGLIEVMGRKPIQYLGFAVITACLFVLCVWWPYFQANPVPFIAIFSISQFFFNFGPNTTTFVIPGEVFPTRWRSTGHGISAAAGKLGAIIGVLAVAPNYSSYPQITLGAFSFIMFTGLLATYLVPETKGRTLEDLAGEE